MKILPPRKLTSAARPQGQASDIGAYEAGLLIILSRVSVSSEGAQTNNMSSSPSRSASGRYVAFASIATNLVPGDTNGKQDVFLHDFRTGETRRVSVASDGTEGNGDSRNPAISADGNWVAFTSSASNLAPGDQPGSFRHNWRTGTTERISITDPKGDSGDLAISADGLVVAFTTISAGGRLVAFSSAARDLVPEDTNDFVDVFVYDRQTGVTERVSLASDGTQGNSESIYPSISGDGRYVAFTSSASNLVPWDTNGGGDPLVGIDIFIHNRQTRETERITRASDGGEGNHYDYKPAISRDGSHVAFAYDSSRLIPGDTNWVNDIFVAKNPFPTGERLVPWNPPPGRFEITIESTEGVYTAEVTIPLHNTCYQLTELGDLR